jgi:hypothetical protein
LIIVVTIAFMFFIIKLHTSFLGLKVIIHYVSRLSICWHLVHVHFLFFICEVVIRGVMSSELIKFIRVSEIVSGVRLLPQAALT